MTATPQRLRRVRALVAQQNGPDAWDRTMECIAKEGGLALRQQYLDALCINWLGPIQRRWTRSDKGSWRAPRDWTYRGLRCCLCGREFEATRIDARWCSGACRQRAYRQRGGES
jgi:hypothetical protein